MRQPGAPQLHDIVLRLCKLVPEPTAATAVKLPRAAKHLLRGAGHAVKHLLLQATPDASGVCAAVLEYLATTEHCCDRAEVTRMLDAGVVELIASSMCPETGSNAHLQSQACRLLAAMAYQLEGVAPLEAEESRFAQRLFPDAIVSALVEYMQRNVANGMQFTVALTAAMKGVCDPHVAKHFNEEALVATLEQALAHGHIHSDPWKEVRALAHGHALERRHVRAGQRALRAGAIEYSAPLNGAPVYNTPLYIARH